MDSTMRLPCQLTRSEREQRADELARALETQETLKADKAAAMSRFGDLIKANERKIFDLGDVVRTGVEFREVPVRYVSDFDRNQIQTIRQDTGEPVGTRAMESHERQQEIDYPDGSSLGPATSSH